MPDLLSCEEFAERTHTSAWTVRRWCREQRVPHLRIGRRLLLPASALEVPTAPQEQGAAQEGEASR